MKPLRTLLLVLAFSVLTFLPTVAFAADASFFGPIIPEECHCEGSAPDWGCVMQVVQNGINFVVTLGVIIFTLSVAYAGAMYMASATNPGQHKKAVQMIQNTVLGLLVLLSAWLLVDFVMKVLYNPNVTAGGVAFGPWEAILSDSDPRMCLEIDTDGPGAIEDPGTQGPDGSEPGEEEPVTEEPTAGQGTYYALLEDADVDIVSSGNCTDKTRSNCTSLDGMRSATVQQILNLQEACGGVVVTGGTETGHSGGTRSHANGYKFDVRTNVTSCIDTNTTAVTPPSFGERQRRDSCGNIYTYERETRSNGTVVVHWDIDVTRACSL